MAQSAWELEKLGLGLAVRVDTDVRVDRKFGGPVGNEGVELSAEITSVGNVRLRGLKCHIRRYSRSVGPAVLGDHRADRRCHFGTGIKPGLRIEMPGLKDPVRFMVTMSCVYRANNRTAVEHRRHLGQVLAKQDAWQLRLNHAKRAAILQRTIGFGVPRVDLAGTARHPQKNDGFVAAPFFRGLPLTCQAR